MRYISLILLTGFLFSFAKPSFAQTGWQWARHNTYGYHIGATEALGGVATDAAGNVIACTSNGEGMGPDTVYFGSIPVYSPTGNEQVIVTKCDSSGHFLWAIGTQYTDATALSTTVDASGSIYVFGTYWSPNFQIGSFVISNSYASQAFFLVKISSSGTVQWVVNAGPFYYGGFATGQFGFARDDANNFYVAGSFIQDTVYLGGQMLINTATQSSYIAKYSSTGALVWAKKIAASGSAGIVAMTATSDDKIYLAGVYSPDSLAVGGSLVTGGQRYIAKLDSGGHAIWAHNLDPNLKLESLCSDAANALYFCGRITGVAIIGSDTLHPTGSWNAAFGKFTSSGTPRWARAATGFYGSGFTICADKCGYIWLGGGFMGNTSFSGHTIIDSWPSYDESMFLAEYDTAGNYKTAQAIPFGGDDDGYVATDNYGNFYMLTDYVTDKILGPDLLPGYGLNEVFCLAKYNYSRNPANVTGPAGVCIGGSITLTPGITGGLWSASNSKATVLSGVVTGVSVGMDTISYTVTNGCGPAVTTKFPVRIIDTLPNPGIISGPSSVCVGASVVLSGSVPGGRWTSSFGYAYPYDSLVVGISPYQDTITYSVSNSCGSSAAKYLMTVDPLPDTGTVSGLSSVCRGDTISFSSTSPGGIWTSSNSRATVSAGLVVGVTAGMDTISYTVTNSCGSLSAYRSITIESTPNAGIITGPGAICVSDTITFSDTVTGGTWSASGGHVSISGDTVFGVYPGVDTIFYTITGVCGSSSVSIPVTVNGLPVVNAISGPSMVCAGQSINLADSTAGGTWSASNPTAMVAAGTVTGISAGEDTISYSVTGACGITTAQVAITINTLPVVAAITGPSQLCVGASVLLQDATPGGVWGSTATVVSIDSGLVSGLAAGVDTITYSVSNFCGIELAIKPVTIEPLPYAGWIDGPADVCVGSSITLTDSVSGGTWTSDTTLTRLTGAVEVQGLSPGTDVVSYTVTNNCGTSIATHPVTIYSLTDTVPITRIGYQLSAPSGYASYQWLLNNVPIPAATNNTYTYSTIGSYSVIVSNASGCVATIQPINISDCGIAEILVYPNPANAIVSIRWCHSVTARVSCIDGKLVKVIPNATDIDLSELPNAVYTITLFDNYGHKLTAKRVSKISR